MKRPLEKPSKPLPTLLSVDFSIASIQFPKLVADFDGFFLGTVYIHACPTRPALIGCTLRMKNEALVSLNTYFVYSTKHVTIENDSQQLVVTEPSHVQRLKESLTAAEVKDIVQKMVTLQNLPSELSQIAFLLTCSQLPASIPSTVVAQQLPSCDLNRLPLIHVLHTYLVPNKYDEKQKRRLFDLTHEQLHELKQLLCTEPWTLVFGMHKLKGIASEALLDKAVKEFGLQFRFPLHIQYAVKMYYKVMRLRMEENHTVFGKGMLNVMIPCMQKNKREELEKQVFEYLQEKALNFLPASPVPPAARGAGGGGDGGANEVVCTKFDHFDATSAIASLKRIQKLSQFHEPQLRGLLVPQLFPPLTARQTEIALHITHHWLTIVEGMPGTGKTALITWCVSHYQNVLLVSFVGMMVKSLQKRNGRRREVAHTIHHILAQHKNGGDAVAEWLRKYQVLIIDEFSNVSMPLFRKLLACLPNISKIVLVGDHRQLKPIEGGDPMGDLIGVFGSQMLHDNLRVVPELKALQFAPAMIASGRANELDFSTPCLTLIDRSFAALYPIFQAKAKEVNILMNLHIVVLVHKGADGREQLNKEVQNMWMKLKVLQRPPPQAGGGGGGVVAVRSNLELFPGCKITFTQNYNKPIEKTAQHDFVSSPVANGELCIVKSIVRKADGFVLTTVDSLDPADEPETKVIWIHEKNGVSPKHIDLGYATTAYKSQGREFPYVIFWTLPTPQEHWTRANAYVAISRGKKQVFIAATTKTDFLTICSQPDPKRKTIFRLLLEQDGQVTNNEPVKCKVSPLVEHGKLKLLEDKRVPCVPLLAASLEAATKK